jgi:hypothetical protein
MVLGTKRQFQAAIDKAHKLGMVARVRPAGPGIYTVPSNSDPAVRYTVTVTRGGEFRCNCLAAGRDLPCCHSAATFVRVVTERAMHKANPPELTAREELFGKGSHR